MYSIILAASISAVVAVAIYAVVTNLVIKTSIRKRREAAARHVRIRHIQPAFRGEGLTGPKAPRTRPEGHTASARDRIQKSRATSARCKHYAPQNAPSKLFLYTANKFS